MRQYSEYTFKGLVALGEAVAYFREADKPHWRPVVTDGMSEVEQVLERGKWSQVKMAEIINREFGLSGDLEISKSAIQRLESPAVSRTEPPLRLIELIASLEIMINPKTQEPYSDDDLRAIAKGKLNWENGERLNSESGVHSQG